MPMYEYGSNGSGWEVAVMVIGMLTFWALIIWAVYLVVTRVSNRSSDKSTDNPQQILDRRLAKGELNEDEYRRRSDLLNAKAKLPVSEGSQ